MEKFDLLSRAMTHLHAGHPELARPPLERLRALLGPESDLDDTPYRYYLAALSNHLGETGPHPEEANLYRQEYDEQAQIDLYYLLTEHLPFMDTTQVVNPLLAGRASGAESLTILSVGIGHGRQESVLLTLLTEPGSPLRHCTVVGIDPDSGSLRRAEHTLRQSEAVVKRGLKLDFVGINNIAEQLDSTDWSLMAGLPGELLVNSTLAVHHMQDPTPGHDARDEFFQRLRLLSPAAVVLTEFDSDHHNVSLPQCFFNSWRFFGVILRAIKDAAATREERNAMKRFFGREVMNIVGSRSDAQRFERHEPTRAWIDRLRRCGFEPLAPASSFTSGNRAEHTVRTASDHVRLGWRGATVCAVICAVPVG